MQQPATIKTLGVLLFPQFEILDVFGPLELFSNLPDRFKIILIAEKKGLVAATTDISVNATADLTNTPQLDILLIPGGLGTRQEVRNQKLLAWIAKTAKESELVLSVCTGAALLAKAGVLDNRRATSNKINFNWVTSQGPQVTWIKQARWVDDGNIITSSGVSAGIDMSLYVIQKLCGRDIALHLSTITEYEWQDNPDHDLFAAQA